MKNILISMFLFGAGIAMNSPAQGTFIFGNANALTRLGAIDGPLAGPEIWAQCLAGPTNDSLTPVGVPIYHRGGFLAGFQSIDIPWADVGAKIFVQMVAWNGTVWGTSLEGVPVSQLGYTDIVSVFLSSPTAAPLESEFTQPAVVPIPEPGAFALLAAGAVLATLWRKGLGHRARGVPRDRETELLS